MLKKNIIKNFKKLLSAALFKLNTFYSNLHEIFFPVSITDDSFIIRGVIKSQVFDSHCIEVKDYMYEPSLIEDFLKTKIVKSILDEYKKEGLKYFKCLITFETSLDNTTEFIHTFKPIYETNDWNTFSQDIKQVFYRNLEKYEDDSIAVRNILIKIIFIDRKFRKKNT